jgi:1-pyrroline-5-carboxylate dehydrogenase
MLAKNTIKLSKKNLRFNSRASVPAFVNEPMLTYKKGTNERNDVEKHIKQFRSGKVSVPLLIGGKEVVTKEKGEIRIPHEHKTVLGEYYKGDASHVNSAIESALKAKESWQTMSFEHRAAIFLKIADLIAGKYRGELNAATMLGQGKNFIQAEVDAACESVDFIRYNVKEVEKLLSQQPISSQGMWNRSEYRPLEGFVYAVTPFNFTAIALNLCLAPALFGNVVIWKPSQHAMLSASVLLKIYKEAGLPDGVVNLVQGNPEEITKVVLANKYFAGLHFTGSTAIFNSINQKIAANLENYVSYPRVVGETGGKDFIFAHPSADVRGLAVGLIRGSFEYAGQKCSACSRAYIPKSIWPELKQILLTEMKSVKMGSPEDPTVLVNSVIHENSCDQVARYLKEAANSSECEIIAGGEVDKSKGWFVQPTIIVTTNPRNKLMSDELFAPVLTLFVYDDAKFEETLDILDTTSKYALTGAFWANDRHAIEFAEKKLMYSCGNFYINDKPTGAVVGQQPFGGGRSSGTNDKAGSLINLLRWTSVRSIKETLVPTYTWTYPYMNE